jgi:dipeptidyl-peptidase-4
VQCGETDWVYMEEVYGRGRTRAFWWSPDSTRIAFLRFDDRPVPDYTIVDAFPDATRVLSAAYPLAGQPNPIVDLGIVSPEAGPVAWVDLSSYEAADRLVVRVGWIPGGESVYFYVQDRAQTWLDFDRVGAAGGAFERLFRRTTGRWVANPGDPHFLSDGSFLQPSELSGFKHLEHREPDGGLRRALTSGPWEVRRLELVDEEGGWVYFTAMRDDPNAPHLYRVRLDGSGFERLTFEPGSHSVRVSPGGRNFVDSYSDIDIPTRVDLRAADGSLVRRLDTNSAPDLGRFDLGRLERVGFPAEDGFPLEGLLLYPPDFDPDRTYPVWLRTYGGPHAPVVRDSWSGGRLHPRMLAQLGFVVFYFDPRSASGKGAESTWTAYRRLGLGELADLEDAVGWLTSHRWVDPARIGISGHSYGGFLTAFAMTHSDLFAAGVASAPVTDWRLYDSIYTERYMDTPQNNPEGYDATSVVRAAANLSGRLLILHGAVDDNVHLQNTLQLVHALQEHDRDFELMIYPRSRHGLRGAHYQRLVVDFMVRQLSP